MFSSSLVTVYSDFGKEWTLDLRLYIRVGGLKAYANISKCEFCQILKIYIRILWVQEFGRLFSESQCPLAQ